MTRIDEKSVKTFLPLGAPYSILNFRYLWNSNNAFDSIFNDALWLNINDICVWKSLVFDFHIDRFDRHGKYDALGITTSNRKSFQAAGFSKIFQVFNSQINKFNDWIRLRNKRFIVISILIGTAQASTAFPMVLHNIYIKTSWTTTWSIYAGLTCLILIRTLWIQR